MARPAGRRQVVKGRAAGGLAAPASDLTAMTHQAVSATQCLPRGLWVLGTTAMQYSGAAMPSLTLEWPTTKGGAPPPPPPSPRPK